LAIIETQLHDVVKLGLDDGQALRYGVRLNLEETLIVDCAAEARPTNGDLVGKGLQQDHE